MMAGAALPGGAGARVAAGATLVGAGAAGAAVGRGATAGSGVRSRLAGELVVPDPPEGLAIGVAR
jgi:hypothetical protein